MTAEGHAGGHCPCVAEYEQMVALLRRQIGQLEALVAKGDELAGVLSERIELEASRYRERALLDAVGAVLAAPGLSDVQVRALAGAILDLPEPPPPETLPHRRREASP